MCDDKSTDSSATLIQNFMDLFMHKFNKTTSLLEQQNHAINVLKQQKVDILRFVMSTILGI